MQEINAKKSLKEGKAPRDLEACPQQDARQISLRFLGQALAGTVESNGQA